jgi:phosphohistidine phosphatase
MLLRHAKSDWSGGQRDHERDLSARGKRAAPLMGAYMAQQKLVPDCALVSTALRARATWDLASRGWTKQPPMTLEERIYDASPSRLLDIVQNADDRNESLLLVGHNPGFEELARMLIDASDGKRSGLAEKFPTAALAVIDFSSAHWADIAPHTGRLERFVTPRELGED